MKIKLLGGMLMLALLLPLGGDVVSSTSRVKTDGDAKGQELDRLAVTDSGKSTGNDQIDISSSYKAASFPFGGLGERITHTVDTPGDNGPMTSRVRSSDVIQEGLSYVPGSSAVTSTVVDDTLAPALTRYGNLAFISAYTDHLPIVFGADFLQV